MERKQSNDHDVCTFFNDLIDDLKVEILCKLPAKILAKFTCVSTTWKRLIINFCFPKMASSKLAYSGYGTCYNKYDPSGAFYDRNFNNAFTVSKKEWLDSCNGLVLICCKKPVMTDPTSPYLYSYHVINFITKQCAFFEKPHPKTAHHIYAALAYDPSKSRHFKVVRFSGFRSLNVFDSKTMDWITLKYQLEDRVAKAKWEKRSIYFEGALYRLSMSGHLIRFLVDQEINESARVQAIELPEVAKTSTLRCVGINKGQIHISHSNESSLRIWMLQQDCSRINNKYEWLLKYTIPSNMIPSKYFHPLAFHPYDDKIILCLSKSIYKMSEYYFGDTQVNESRLSHTHIHDKQPCGDIFPFLECEIPFATTTADEPIVSILSHCHLSSFIFLTTLYFDSLHFKLIADLTYIYFFICI
jgi:hypothetical protein